jgi:DNA-binding XRE family transcriptional regulator
MKAESKEKFMELRAHGMSFAQISMQIGVSKTTLIKWNREMAQAIASLHSSYEIK